MFSSVETSIYRVSKNNGNTKYVDLSRLKKTTEIQNMSIYRVSKNNGNTKYVELSRLEKD